MKPLQESFLLEILSQPTAPFREKYVIQRVVQELELHHVPFFADSVGNLVIGADSLASYQRILRQTSSEPLRVYIAHMDHPGFHGTEWKSENELLVKWHGGSPTQHLEGAKVWLAHPSDWRGSGKLIQATLLSSSRAIDTASVVLESSQFAGGMKNLQKRATEFYGGFAFRAPYWKEDEKVYTHAADDLVGAFSIASLAIETYGNKRKSKKSSASLPFIGLLTRAEEVGFIGAIGHFQKGWLQKSRRKVICISLETSRTLPGADIGKGPVVRLGDRFTVFDPAGLHILGQLAQTVLPTAHQKRIMDGGSCEATAATVFGFTSIGISVPLGNYHNQSLEGGPDAAPPNGPAPEFVHLQDVAGLLELCRALLKPKLPWPNPWNTRMKEFTKEFKRYQPLLRSGP
jgi:endoglucanase